MDDKSVVKAKGLWEDWHMRQLGEQPGRNNHRSGAGAALPSGGELGRCWITCWDVGSLQQILECCLI